MRGCKRINIVDSSNIMRGGSGASGDANGRQDRRLDANGNVIVSDERWPLHPRESTEFYSPGTRVFHRIVACTGNKLRRKKL